MEICPFVYGRALRPREFYNREEALRRLLGRLVTGQATALIGPAHTGKTSFLNYLLAPESRRKVVGNKLDSGIFSYIDSHMLGKSHNQSAFWKQALLPLTMKFGQDRQQRSDQETTLTPIYQAYQMAETNQFGTFTLEQLFHIVGREGWQFVLLIDEFDALLSHPFLNSTEFYGGLRSLASRCEGFNLVIASRHSLELLNQETQTINPHGSPYFNVFTEFRLGPLPKAHANALVKQAKDRFGSLDRAFIFRTSGLHPYLLQAAAGILWELHEQGRQGPPKYRKAGDELYRQTRSHFTDTWLAWSQDEKKVITSIALAQINGMVNEHSFAWQRLIANITDYGSELRKLRDSGIILSINSGWKLTQEAFLWWWADKIKAIVRDDSNFECWLCAQEMDGIFTREECQRMNEAAKKVSGAIGKGATTLIDAFAKGLAEAAAKAIGG